MCRLRWARAPAPSRSHARLRQRHFPDFYRVNHLSVFRALAATLGDTDLAREAADEAMTRAFQHWQSVSGYDNPPGWVYRVGLNWARSRLRKQKREDLHDAPPAMAFALIVLPLVRSGLDATFLFILILTRSEYLLALILSLSRLLTSGSEAIVYEVQGTRALFAAQSGLELAQPKLFPLGAAAPADCPATISTPVTFNDAALNGCSVVVSCSPFSPTQPEVFRLISRSECVANEFTTSRTVQIEVRK